MLLSINFSLSFKVVRVIAKQINKEPLEVIGTARCHQARHSELGNPLEGGGSFAQARRSREGKLNDLSGRTVQNLPIAVTNGLINEKMCFS